MLIAELFDTIFVVIIKYMSFEINLNNIKKFDQKSFDIQDFFLFSKRADSLTREGIIRALSLTEMPISKIKEYVELYEEGDSTF